MTTPIWFLDIDGVVNAAGVDLPDHLVRTDATTQGVTWPIHYSPEVVAFINMIHRSRLAEVRWLTTWGPDARLSLAPAVALDEFPAYEMYDGLGWWKAEIVAASIRHEGRPVIWTDDDIEPSHLDAMSGSVPIRTIVPRTEIGLTSSDLRSILDFIDAQETS